MTEKQAYYTLFFLLDVYFDDHQDGIWGLRGLLSDMDPYIWVGQRSADPATEDDFSNQWKKVTKTNEANPEDALQACLAFMDFYRTEFEFALDDAMDYLRGLDWNKAAEKFCKMYPSDDRDIPNENPFVVKNKELFDDAG